MPLLLVHEPKRQNERALGSLFLRILRKLLLCGFTEKTVSNMDP